MPPDRDDAFDRLHRRAIARDEERAAEARAAGAAERAVDRRVVGWLAFAALVALVYLYGWWGFALWLVGVVVYVWVKDYFVQRTPGAEADEVERLAETFARHTILADLHLKGDLQWAVGEDGVHVADHPDWDRFWPLVEGALSEFEKSSPRARRRRVESAKQRSLAARQAMMTFSKERNAKPCWWAVPEPGDPHA